MNDAKMLELLHKNPNKGMNVLIDEYAGLIYATVKHVLANSVCVSSDIEDCVADTFSEFYLELQKFNPKMSSIKNYLCLIAKNNAIDILRRRKKAELRVDFEDENFPIQIPDGTNLEEDVLKQEKIKEVLKEIEALGEPDSSIIFRKYYYGESAEEIAENLKMSVSAVNTRAHRALKKLKAKLGGGN